MFSLLLLACVEPAPEARPERERPPRDTDTQVDTAGDTAGDDTGTPDDTGAVHHTPTPGDPALWTFLVYIVGDNDLEGWVMHDLDELEAGGPGADVRVVALADRAEGYSEAGGDWTGTRLYDLADDGEPTQVGTAPLEDWGEVDMADPATLARFLERGAEIAPAEHYVLVLWNHGTGWYADGQPPPGIGWDDSSEDDLSIAEGELDAGIASFTAAHGPFEVVAFDACNMAYFEVGHALRTHARHLVAAQTTVGMQGLQYTDSLAALVADTDMSASTLADTLARAPVELSGENTFSATDLSQMDALASALDGFAGAALADDTAWTALTTARAAARGAEPGVGYRLWSMDLNDLAAQAELGAAPELAAAATDLRAALDVAMVGAYATENFAWTGGLNLYADTRGLGLYTAPTATWAAATRWGDVLARLEAEEQAAAAR
jgi:hypothetical protein